MSTTEQRFSRDETVIWQALQEHKGHRAAMPAGDLAQRAQIDPRDMREVINHLIITHGRSIGSSAGRGGGYFLIKTEAERDKFNKAFRARGITGLQKAAAINQSSVLEVGLDSAIEDHNDQANPVPSAQRKINGLGATIKRSLEIITADPKLYGQEIEVLRKDFGAVIVGQEKLKQINETARRLQELTGGLM